MNESPFTKYLIFFILGFIALITILVSVLYRPAKRMGITIKIIRDKDKYPIVEFVLTNSGKRKLNMVYPYIKFKRGYKSASFQIQPEQFDHHFKKVMPPGVQETYRISLDKYENFVSSDFLTAGSVRITAEDDAGMNFHSSYVNLKA
jgi:hypothetical protein